MNFNDSVIQGIIDMLDREEFDSSIKYAGYMNTRSIFEVARERSKIKKDKKMAQEIKKYIKQGKQVSCIPVIHALKSVDVAKNLIFRINMCGGYDDGSESDE